MLAHHSFHGAVVEGVVDAVVVADIFRQISHKAAKTKAKARTVRERSIRMHSSLPLVVVVLVPVGDKSVDEMMVGKEKVATKAGREFEAAVVEEVAAVAMVSEVMMDERSRPSWDVFFSYL